MQTYIWEGDRVLEDPAQPKSEYGAFRVHTWMLESWKRDSQLLSATGFMRWWRNTTTTFAVFHKQSKLHMKGFRSLREGEAVEFMFKKSSKGLEAVMVTGPNGAPCLGSVKRLKKRRSKGDE